MENVLNRASSPEPPAGKRLGSAAFFFRLRRRAAKPLRHLRPTVLRRSATDLLLVGGIFGGFVLAVNLILRYVL